VAYLVPVNLALREREMVDERKETVKEAEIKKQLEAIAGHEIDLKEDVLIPQLFFFVASYNRVEKSAVTKQSIILPIKTCNDATVIDVYGVSSTGGDGKRIFQLRDFICVDVPSSIVFSEPVNVVATPRSEGPFFLTMTHAVRITADITDVQITVFAWNANGEPAPNVPFDWRCRAQVNSFV
jgi:hypothetical protein